MARPKKEPHEKRTASTRADLTMAEKVYLQEQARLSGLSEADYVRRRILGFAVQPPPARVDAALVSEVNRIGVNLNQLARAQNADREFHGDWQALAEKVGEILERITGSYGS